MNVRNVVKAVGYYGLVVAVCGVLALLGFEALYRWQVIDTYRPELQAYNPEAVLHDTTATATILAMGDSFTAGSQSYPGYLQALLPDYRVINAGVSGTGVIQALVMAPRRFDTFKPSIFIYQVYVGNDLINIRYPVNWQTLSPVRNLYGVVVDRLRSVSFLNYRLGQHWYAWANPPVPRDTLPAVVNAPFSPVSYSPRQQTYLRADPKIWEDQILLTGDRQVDFDVFLAHLKELVALCTEGACAAYIVIVPHAAQVHPRYLAQMRQLGAQFDDPQRIASEDYPFVAKVNEAFEGLPHVSILNPLSLLQTQEQQGHVLYFNNDGHLNLEGQEVLAAYVKTHLALP